MASVTSNNHKRNTSDYTPSELEERVSKQRKLIMDDTSSEESVSAPLRNLPFPLASHEPTDRVQPQPARKTNQRLSAWNEDSSSSSSAVISPSSTSSSSDEASADDKIEKKKEKKKAAHGGRRKSTWHHEDLYRLLTLVAKYEAYKKPRRWDAVWKEMNTKHCVPAGVSHVKQLKKKLRNLLSSSNPNQGHSIRSLRTSCWLQGEC